MNETNTVIIIENFAFVPTFQTAGSMSFTVVRSSDEPDLSNQKGWVDLHEIQSPESSVTIRGSLPSECLRFEFLKRLIDEVLSCLRLSDDIARDVLFFKSTDCIDMSRESQASGDVGTTDRITTSRSFRLPRNQE